ncbi:MAG: hypothetical protein ABSC90_15735 [Acidimicrobiales bacterium]|jgi:hypothetical protein
MARKTQWKFTYPTRSDGTVGLNSGPFRRLPGDVFFPVQVEIVAAPDGGPKKPRVRMRFEIEDDEPKCTELAFIRLGGGPAIGAKMIRDIEIGELIDEARAWQAESAGLLIHSIEAAFGPDGFSIDEDGRVSFWNETHIDNARDGILALSRQRTITDDLLAEVAAIYLADDTGSPTKAVQVNHSERPSKRTAIHWVGLARKRGLIPPYERKKRSDDGVD